MEARLNKEDIKLSVGLKLSPNPRNDKLHVAIEEYPSSGYVLGY